MDIVSNSHVLTNINMFSYICPVKWNLQILNGIKSPAKGVGIVIIKHQNKLYYSNLDNIIYAT